MKRFRSLSAIACLLVLSASFLSGCASIESGDPGARLVVNVGTMKAIEAVPPAERLERTERIIELCDLATDMLDEENVALRIVYDTVYQDIDWTSLEPSDAMLLRTLITTLAQRIQEHIEAQAVDGNSITTVKTAVSWIRKSASDYRLLIQ